MILKAFLKKDLQFCYILSNIEPNLFLIQYVTRVDFSSLSMNMPDQISHPFHLDFGFEITENTRHKMQTLYSAKNLILANDVLGSQTNND